MAERDVQKQRCTLCHRTIFYLDSIGIHIKCRSCKQIVTIPWQEVTRQCQAYGIFIHQTA